MRRNDLASALGISAEMVRRLAKRGMPTDSAEGAKRWRAQNLDLLRTKQYRAGGNTGKRYEPKPKPVVPPTSAWDAASPIPGVAEANMHASAALFAVRFGIERFGPLLVHLGCVMSDDGHDVQTLALSRNADPYPDIADHVWEAISDEYFRMLPIGCPEDAELKCTGY